MLGLEWGWAGRGLTLQLMAQGGAEVEAGVGARFQNGGLALAPRTFVLKVCNSYKDGGRFVFKMGVSPWRRGHSS